jgi:chaperone BCS1
MGIMLYRPPGTGKTSLATALASHMDVPLALIKLGGMSDFELESAFAKVPEGSIVLMEDIDCSGACISREKAKDSEESNSSSDDDSDDDSDSSDSSDSDEEKAKRKA